MAIIGATYNSGDEKLEHSREGNIRTDVDGWNWMEQKTAQKQKLFRYHSPELLC